MQTVRAIASEYGVKISGEPWSALGGYYRGHMKGMMEWNDKHKETLRRFYRGDECVVPALAGQISGGEGLYYGQKTSKYIRFVAVHDGFTLYDVVNYNEKNNWANNECNRDGCNNNASSASPNREIAFRRMKSMMAANILSRGVPLICAGDELARTQRGNNNAYCQDNELSWLNWKNFSQEQKDLYLFVRQLTALRAGHPNFANLDVFTGDVVPSNKRKDIEWIRSDGAEMTESDWHNPTNHILACVINGRGGEVSPNPSSRDHQDDDFMILMCGNTYGTADFCLPTSPNGQPWNVVFDTSGSNRQISEENHYTLEPYSYVLLTSRRPERTKSLERPFLSISKDGHVR
jgi:glycogen operon protein